jgi:hypothetical protein
MTKQKLTPMQVLVAGSFGLIACVGMGAEGFKNHVWKPLFGKPAPAVVADDDDDE